MPDLLSALGGTFSEESGLEKEEMWLDKQLLLSCRHGWVPAPVDFHHYILLSPSLLDAEDGNFRNGGPCWTRTSDTLINSQVLYQLSYAGIRKHGNVLPSQGAIPQLLSALWSLTSVFGMGTGISSMPSSPHYFL